MTETIDYLRQRGWEPASETRDELIGRCPYFGHTDNKPSFSINKNTGQFNCLSCNKGGSSLVTIIMYVEALSFEEVVARLQPSGTPQRNDRLRMIEIGEQVNKYFEAIMSPPEDAKESIHLLSSKARNYLRKRGIDDSIINKYRIGYAHKNMPKRMYTRGISLEEMSSMNYLKNGIYMAEDRVSIPITFAGKVIGHSFRTIDNDERKYINCYNTETHPSDNWFCGMDNTPSEDVFVVEGIFDYIRMREYGYYAVASMGTSINQKRLRLLKKHKRIYLMLDSDKAGQNAVEKIFELSRGVFGLSQVFVCILKDKDPDSSSKSEVDAAVQRAVPIAQWLIERYFYYCHPEEKIVKIGELEEIIKRVESETERHVLTNMLQAYLRQHDTWLDDYHQAAAMFARQIADEYKHASHPIAKIDTDQNGVTFRLLNYEYRFDKSGKMISAQQIIKDGEWSLVYQGRR